MEEFLKNPVEIAKNMSCDQLEEVLKILREAYYNDESIVPDNIYDDLEEIMRAKNPSSSLLTDVGASVEFDPRKTELPYWMGSLDKIKVCTGFDNWMKRFPGPYVVSHKLDGISALLVIGNDTYKLYTRGSGSHGLDISHLISYLGLAIDSPGEVVAIRGEIIMSKENWKKHSANNSNARNMVSGLVNSKHPDVAIFADVDFVAYEIIDPPGIEPHRQFHRLERWGFKVASNCRLDRDQIDYESLLEMLERDRVEGRYQIDGLIITQDSPYERNVSGNPKYSIAFKSNEMPGNVQVATVRQVIWSPSRHGYLKPRIEIEPVVISDSSGSVTISFCTGFNAQYIKEHSIGPGSMVKIVRSGDVIPYITEVVLGTEAQMPNGVEWYWNESGVDILLKDPEKFQNVAVESLVYFFKTMGARYVSDSTVAKFVDAGLTNVQTILGASVNDLAQLPGLGQKSAERIRESLDGLLMNVEPARLMAASGAFGQGLGIKKLQLVIDHYPDCLEWRCDWRAQGVFSTPDATVFESQKFRELVAKIIKIPGYQTKTASKFVFNLPNFQEFLSTLPDYSFKEDAEPSPVESQTISPWNGQRVVFSGFRNAALEKVITDNGGTVTGSVTGKTTMVLVKDFESESSKVTKARELGIPVKTLDEFIYS